MKGKVEVYAVHSDGSEKLLLEEPNLVVDGAGESIVDMLTTPSSVLGISPRVMDTSNWRWGAISFGPAASSFSENAYFYPPNPNEWADRSNPNMLEYTEDFYDDPGINPPSDLTGVFWQTAQGRIGSFSSILETNPFGRPSSVELSVTTDVTGGLANFVPFIQTVAPTKFFFNDSYNSTLTFYVKKPTYGLTPSSFQFQGYNLERVATNGATFEYLNGGTIPTVKSISSGITADVVDAGEGWYRCAVMVSGLGNGTSPSPTDNITIYFYVGNTANYGITGEPNLPTALAGVRLWISSPQFEQHIRSGNFSATPYQSVAGSAPTVAENGDPCNLLPKDLTSYINQIGTDGILRPLWASSLTGDASSYTPPYQMPSYPDPLNKKLEDTSTSYSLVSSLAASGSETHGQSYGQFENRIQWGYADPSSYFQGVYPQRSGALPQSYLVSSYEGDFSATPTLNMVVNSPANAGVSIIGAFNFRYYMDYRGFIHLKYDMKHAAAEPVTGQAGVSGVADTNEVFVKNPRVTMAVNIGKWDVWAMNLYGGLHQIGLWNMDCKKALKNNSPPFLEGEPVELDPKFINTSTGISQQEFKLFAKKTFTENLCAIKDDGITAGNVDPQALKILWTIDFRSQHD